MTAGLGSRWGTLTTPTVPPVVPAALLLSTVVLLRPGVWGEYLALAGLLVVGAAAVAAMVRREAIPPRPERAVTVLAALLCTAYLWMIVQGLWTAGPAGIRDRFQDFALTVGSTVGTAVVLADPRTRRAVGRGFVLLVIVLSASWVVTALIWIVAGVGAGSIGAVPVGGIGPQPVYFPVTISYSTSPVFGIDVPRLTGVGRESGWMAMYCAAGWFLADGVGYRAWWVKALLLAGLVGTLSTAGFGVFVVVVAWHVFLRPRGSIGLDGFVRQIAGLGAAGLAAWAAVAAPVLGLDAKQTGNETSLAERQDATVAGLRALTRAPWGGQGSEKQAGINLLSDIAVNGLPFVILIAAALLVPPVLARRDRGGEGGPGGSVALVVFLTLLLSQPAAASTWAFLLVTVALAADGLSADERAEAGSRAVLVTRVHRWCAGRRPAGR